MTLEKKLATVSETLGLQMWIKFESNPSYCQQIHPHRSTENMTSVSETTRTLRYELQSREIYIEEPITSPEILLEHPQTQDENISSIQETPNSQFRHDVRGTWCQRHCILSASDIRETKVLANVAILYSTHVAGVSCLAPSTTHVPLPIPSLGHTVATLNLCGFT